MKKGRIILGVAVALVVLVVVAMAVVKAVYLDKLRPKIEAAASEATGLEVTVEGMGFDVLPSLAVAAEGVTVKGEKSEVLSVGEVDIAVALGPLLSRRVEVSRVRVVGPVINIVRDKSGRYNFEGRRAPAKTPEAEKEEGGPSPLAAVLAREISVVDGSLTYLDEATGSTASVRDFDIEVRDVSVEGLSSTREVRELIKSVAFRGALDVESFEAGNYTVSDISSDYAWENGVLDIEPMELSLYGGRAEGKCVIDLRGERPRVAVTQGVKGLDLGRMVRETRGRDVLSGKADLSAELSMEGASASEAKRSLEGTISLRGADLKLKGADIDASLAKLEETQKFNLFDVGSFFVLGPLGPLLTKGTDYAGLAADGVKKGGESLITEYVFDWRIDDGVATAKDVAFATRENRMAFDGRLDIANERFADLTGAVLTPGGCAKYTQTIVGPFNKPRVKAEGVVKSLVKPLSSLLGKAKDVVTVGECRPFYTGSVEHPAP
ncbi:MAG: AsmA family protein [Nitrospirota bacterium]